jgi:hypothetical protein
VSRRASAESIAQFWVDWLDSLLGYICGWGFFIQDPFTCFKVTLEDAIVIQLHQLKLSLLWCSISDNWAPIFHENDVEVQVNTGQRDFAQIRDCCFIVRGGHTSGLGTCSVYDWLQLHKEKQVQHYPSENLQLGYPHYTLALSLYGAS